MSDKEYFEAWLVRENSLARIFKQRTVDVYRITADDKKVLLNRLEGQLSPENLTCDGELSGARVNDKAKRLYGAQAYLESLWVPDDFGARGTASAETGELIAKNHLAGGKMCRV